MNQDWFYEFVKCDSRACPARVKGYFAKEELVLAFCLHHFTYFERTLADKGWRVVARDRDLAIRNN